MSKLKCPWCSADCKKEPMQESFAADKKAESYVATDYDGSIEYYCGILGRFVCTKDNDHVFFPAADDDDS